MRILMLLTALTLFMVSSCNSDDGGVQRMTYGNYELNLTNFQDETNTIIVEVLDENRIELKREVYLNIPQYEEIRFNFTEGSILRILVQDENFFSVEYELYKDGVKILDENIPGNTFAFIEIELF